MKNISKVKRIQFDMGHELQAAVRACRNAIEFNSIRSNSIVFNYPNRFDRIGFHCNRLDRIGFIDWSSSIDFDRTLSDFLSNTIRPNWFPLQVTRSCQFYRLVEFDPKSIELGRI